MPNSTQAVYPYTSRRCQFIQQDTNNVFNQASVREVQFDVNELPDMSSGSGGVSSPASRVISKAALIALITIVSVAAIAAVAIPLLIAFLKSEITTTTTTTTSTTATTTTTTTTSTTTSTTSTTTTTTTTSTTTTTTTATTTTTTTSNAIVYSQSFSSGTTPSSQCTAWTTFRALLVGTSYTSLTISGSNDPTGITLTNAVYVNAIAQALRTYSTYGPVSSNSYSWQVGGCGSGPELTATGCICCCNTGYTVRPCIGNSNWGGVNSNACSAGSQTLTVTIM
ncbi:unnamed protein product [Rotaria socialis]|uniref:Uncharacterized protein n=1 Tax=Rotaria socialis TaxID=392032 RepID=A0A817TH05_9BILA|nr:unnamed protein product [Rotaria socialis]